MTAEEIRALIDDLHRTADSGDCDRGSSELMRTAAKALASAPSPALPFTDAQRADAVSRLEHIRYAYGHRFSPPMVNALQLGIEALNLLAASAPPSVCDCQVYESCAKCRSVRALTPETHWQPIETCAHYDVEYFFWVVPKTADETYCDTRGVPIISTHAPFMHRGKWKSWPALSKATHWMKPPAPHAA